VRDFRSGRSVSFFPEKFPTAFEGPIKNFDNSPAAKSPAPYNRNNRSFLTDFYGWPVRFYLVSRKSADSVVANDDGPNGIPNGNQLSVSDEGKEKRAPRYGTLVVDIRRFPKQHHFQSK